MPQLVLSLPGFKVRVQKETNEHAQHWHCQIPVTPSKDSTSFHTHDRRVKCMEKLGFGKT